MEKTIKHIHGVGGKTIFTITLAVLYILERITLTECIYSVLIHAAIIEVLTYIVKALENSGKKLKRKIDKLEDNGRDK